MLESSRRSFLRTAAMAAPAIAVSTTVAIAGGGLATAEGDASGSDNELLAMKPNLERLEDQMFEGLVHFQMDRRSQPGLLEIQIQFSEAVRKARAIQAVTSQGREFRGHLSQYDGSIISANMITRVLAEAEKRELAG